MSLSTQTRTSSTDLPTITGSPSAEVPTVAPAANFITPAPVASPTAPTPSPVSVTLSPESIATPAPTARETEQEAQSNNVVTSLGDSSVPDTENLLENLMIDVLVFAGVAVDAAMIVRPRARASGSSSQASVSEESSLQSNSS